MIVQCPSCTSRYRIRDANIPPSGGKIRCPSCSHSFIVYPETEDDDSTSITGSNEIAALLSGDSEPDDDGKTEIVQGNELDKMRAIEALKKEMGSALEGDGTVEIQNPLAMWKAAQEAKAADKPADEEPVAEYGDSTIDHDDYDIAKTEIVSPDALNIPIPAMSKESNSSAESKKPGLPKPNIPKPNVPKPNVPKPGASVPTPPPPANEVWSDPDATVDAGLHIETASMEAPGSVPNLRDEQRNPSAQSGPPANPGAPPPGPPAQPPRSVTQDDSGPNAPTTDPFALPESDPFASAGSNPAQQPSSQNLSDHTHSQPEAADVPVGSQANDPFADLQPGASSEPAGGPDPRHQGPWKLKTNFGLTYEFPDNKSLRSWMSSREELDGHTLSADGENFYEIREFPQLHRSPSMVSQQIPSYSASERQDRPPSGGYAQQPPPGAPTGQSGSGLNANGQDQVPAMQGQAQRPPSSGSGPMPQPASSGFTSPDQFGSGQRNSMSPGAPGLGGGNAPGFGQAPPAQRPPAQAPVRNEYVPPSQASAWDKILWLVLVVLLVAAGLIAVQTFEIFDIVGEARKVLGMPAKVEQPVIDPVNNSGAAPAETTAFVEQSEEEQAELAEQFMRDARRFKTKNKLADALRKLETVEQIDDSDIEIYEMRAEIYDELGKSDEAEAARARISELTPASDDADAGTPDAS